MLLLIFLFLLLLLLQNYLLLLLSDFVPAPHTVQKLCAILYLLLLFPASSASLGAPAPLAVPAFITSLFLMLLRLRARLAALILPSCFSHC